jgi:hypothetical protein
MDLKPRARRFARRMRDEYWCARQLGLERMLREPFTRRSRWWSRLPLQRPLRIGLPSLAISQGWPEALRAARIPFVESVHTVYLPPATLALEPFAALRDRYPADAALKISKHEGGIDGAPYAKRGAESALYRAFSYDHRRLTLVANVLHQHDIAPRLYDLLEIDCGGLRHAAYAVQHVDGRPPNDAEWAAGLARFRELEARRAFKISALQGYGHIDFARPHCNGNAWIEHASGRFLYVDFQNFLLCDHGARLAELAREIGHELLGLESDPPACARSLDALDAALRTHGTALEDAVIIDASLGSGERLAPALRRGARWVHGVGPERELRGVEERLFALGCTRFSLAAEESLQAAQWSLPAFLERQATRAILLLEDPTDALRSRMADSAWSFAWIARGATNVEDLARSAQARLLVPGAEALLGRRAT